MNREKQIENYGIKNAACLALIVQRLEAKDFKP
jgi:hypothetical protein